MKKPRGILIEIGLRLHFNLQRIYILTILIHPTLEHGISLHFFITEMTKTCWGNYCYDYGMCHFSQWYVIAL